NGALTSSEIILMRFECPLSREESIPESKREASYARNYSSENYPPCAGTRIQPQLQVTNASAHSENPFAPEGRARAHIESVGQRH
ncbi:hypothetical protein K0M31_018901, partial [Melipona bicolor]